jgi:hypothetical protein
MYDAGVSPCHDASSARNWPFANRQVPARPSRQAYRYSFQLGENEEAVNGGREPLRNTISFYGSTPAYRPVLAFYGWGELGDELHRLSKLGEWDQMADVVPDEVVDLMGVYGRSSDAGAEIVGRFGGVADRVQLVVPDDDEEALALLASIRGSSH